MIYVLVPTLLRRNGWFAALRQWTQSVRYLHSHAGAWERETSRIIRRLTENLSITFPKKNPEKSIDIFVARGEIPRTMHIYPATVMNWPDMLEILSYGTRE